MIDYKLEKWIWTEQDFQDMGWHDATVYGFKMHENLEFDLDYIFKWNEPEVEGFFFTFWVAPCTLVFERPANLSFELTQSLGEWLEIEDIELKLGEDSRHWTIITHQGEISFEANSFRQFVRMKPSFQLEQVVPYDERNGFSFDQRSGESIAPNARPEIEQRRKKKLEDYELAKRRFILSKELEKLNDGRADGQIDTKSYSSEKRKLKEQIDSLNFYLRGSRYEK